MPCRWCRLTDQYSKLKINGAHLVIKQRLTPGLHCDVEQGVVSTEHPRPFPLGWVDKWEWEEMFSNSHMHQSHRWLSNSHTNCFKEERSMFVCTGGGEQMKTQ